MGYVEPSIGSTGRGQCWRGNFWAASKKFTDGSPPKWRLAVPCRERCCRQQVCRAGGRLQGRCLPPNMS
eukprot:4506654-Prymnesium_polylepis.2